MDVGQLCLLVYYMVMRLGLFDLLFWIMEVVSFYVFNAYCFVTKVTILYLQEHLLIVCELLKANLYEFHKFNRESGGEVYFTMPRLQVCSMHYSY